MDREIAPEVRQRRVAKRVVTIVIALAAIAFSLAATVRWLRPSLDASRVQFARVERGAVESTLDANGTVIPLVEQVVSSPVEARVLRIERRAGDKVRAGDELLALDIASTQLEAQRLNDRVSQARSANDELTLKLEESIASLRAQIEQKKLDAKIFHYTADQRARLRSEGLIAEQDALSAAASAKKSDIELEGLEQALRRALRSRDLQLATARGEVAAAEREREESRRQLELAMLRAERDGVLTSIVNEIGATVRRGEILARIADLSAYRVEATISDIHAARLAPGMRARVSLDAARISGTIESVDPRIVNGVARFFIVLDEPSHPQLRNNMRAEVEVITGARSGALVVRRGALARSDANSAFVVRGDDAVRVPVQFGLAGKDTIEIKGGLREGDELVISDLSDFEGVQKIRLKGNKQ
ncbi:MAG: efflux RND transporter periplasmic adaptor subunit [Acidobacteriota bacterium]|nr:efflux RND transporter periplasmic adaptor subunit [Acidobacteriota bacterium]